MLNHFSAEFEGDCRLELANIESEDYGFWNLNCPSGNFSVNLVNPQDATTTSRPSTDSMVIVEDEEKMVSSKDPCPQTTTTATTSVPDSVSENDTESVKDNGFNHTYCILAIVMVVIFFVLVLSIQGAKKLFCKSEPSEKVKITKQSPPSPKKN